MQITALLKTFIYLISSSLFMPVLLALSLLTLWILVYSGRFFKSWLERRRIRARMAETGDALPDLILTQKYDGVLPSAVTCVLKEICSLNGREQRIRIVNLLRDTEQRMWASLDSLKMVIRLGPGLGLIGTLIPMGTGLSSLGQGDLSQLSQDLVVAFTTTVVGMALGLVAYVYFTIQRRWVETDIKNIQLAAELLTRGGTGIMRYLKESQDRGTGMSDNDPMSGVANLFDLGLVFIVGLLIALFGAFHLQDLLAKDSTLTLVKKTEDGQIEIIEKRGQKIKAMKVSKSKAKGKGERLGTAYRLANGEMIYVPD